MKFHRLACQPFRLGEFAFADLDPGQLMKQVGNSSMILQSIRPGKFQGGLSRRFRLEHLFLSIQAEHKQPLRLKCAIRIGFLKIDFERIADQSLDRRVGTIAFQQIPSQIAMTVSDSNIPRSVQVLLKR